MTATATHCPITGIPHAHTAAWMPEQDTCPTCDNPMNPADTTITVSIPTATVRVVTALRRLMLTANGMDGQYAVQAPGHLYGDLHDTLAHLLDTIVTPFGPIGDVAMDLLLDSYGEDDGETKDTLAAAVRATVHAGLDLYDAAYDDEAEAHGQKEPVRVLPRPYVVTVFRTADDR